MRISPARNPDKTEMEQNLRLQKVISMLDTLPDVRLAVATDGTNDAMPVFITAAIRGVAAFEMTIPHSKYDAWNLMELINRHGGAVPNNVPSRWIARK